jgi:hypothetical protein
MSQIPLPIKVKRSIISTDWPCRTSIHGTFYVREVKFTDWLAHKINRLNFTN